MSGWRRAGRAPGCLTPAGPAAPTASASASTSPRPVACSTPPLSGALDNADMRIDPVFGLAVPKAVAGIDPRLLDPRASWADGDAYDAQAAKLVGLFVNNFRKFGDVAGISGLASPQRVAAE